MLEFPTRILHAGMAIRCTRTSICMASYDHRKERRRHFREAPVEISPPKVILNPMRAIAYVVAACQQYYRNTRLTPKSAFDCLHAAPEYAGGTKMKRFQVMSSITRFTVNRRSASMYVGTNIVLMFCSNKTV